MPERRDNKSTISMPRGHHTLAGRKLIKSEIVIVLGTAKNVEIVAQWTVDASQSEILKLQMHLFTLTLLYFILLGW